MITKNCTVCGEIVYVEDSDTGEFEWKPGSIHCGKLDQYYCAEHKPCCAIEVHEIHCNGLDEEEDDGEYMDEDLADDEDDEDDDDYDYDDDDEEYDEDMEDPEVGV